VTLGRERRLAAQLLLPICVRPLLSGKRLELPLPKNQFRENCELNHVVSLEVTPVRCEAKERWRELCERAVVEQDSERFVATIQELLQVLEDNDERRRNQTALRMPLRERPANSSCPVA
jgi:hypothetical protein